MEKSKKKWQTVIGIALGIGIVTAIQVTRSSNPYNRLISTSKEINEKGVIMVDRDTRLDSTSVIKDPLTLVYYYTIVTVDKDSITIDTNEAEKALSKQTQENVDASPEMEDFRKHSIFLKYTYKDKKGKYLFDFTIKPKKIE